MIVVGELNMEIPCAHAVGYCSETHMLPRSDWLLTLMLAHCATGRGSHALYIYLIAVVEAV